MYLSRTRLLYGDEAVEAFASSRVIVFGLGGVGSWCAETLVRSGIGHITLVDADCVDATNINRQLPATSLTIGQPKALALAERLATIMPQADIQPVQAYYDADTAADFALADYDIVIDAIDSLASKALLMLQACQAPGVTLLSSMGAARRLDPGRIQVAEFWSVKGCPLARALRDRFKRMQVRPCRKIRCVYSDEQPSGEPKGTSMAVTASFGLRLAAEALQAIARKCPRSTDK